MAQKEISHEGIVISINTQETRVEIISKSACASCSASGLCSTAEAVKKEVCVATNAKLGLKVGQVVQVCMRKSMGNLAVLLCYVLPLVILLILVLSLSYAKINDLLCGLIGLGGVLLYYCVIYILKDKIAKHCEFYIKSIK